jgi:glutathionylspermidine synthase
MKQEIRQQYNSKFTKEKYAAFLDDIATSYDHRPPFRIAETPVFLPKQLTERLVEACEEITEDICQPNFKELTQGAIEHDVPNETEKTLFLQMDFGICEDENGELTPQLIEIQGFPSLYFFQHMIAQKYKEHFDIPENYTYLFNDLNPEEYIDILKRGILAGHEPQHVAIVEIEPETQTTQIDFIVAQREIGIAVLCVSDLIVEGRDVFYLNDAGEKIQLKRIFHRVIFDDLVKRDDLKREFRFTDDLNVEYAGHPNWFFRISKYTMPLLDSQYVPQSFFLNELKEYPSDLENYVLKPLFSYAGMGVLLDITKADLDKIEDKQNYILQKKVAYAPVVVTPDEPSKCEIRMLMIWLPEMEKPMIINNLARLSKGKMIGVRYNKDKDWVGGSVGFFEK